MSKKSSAKINIPTTIRFNPNEDNIEDVSSIIQQEDAMLLHDTGNTPELAAAPDKWRKEFLHGTFFSRKRASSIEDISSLASNQISMSLPLNGPAASGGGTWKMIKGKVSQAMEDIKSSKPDAVPKKLSTDGCDSDIDIEDRSESDNDSDAEMGQRKVCTDASFYSKLSSAKKRLSKCKMNKSSESGKDIGRDSFDRDGSPLRSSLLFKKKMRTSPSSTTAPPPPGTTASPSKATASTDICTTNASKGAHPSTPSRIRRRHVRSETEYKQQHDVEIESGIEITEEMSLHCSNRTERDEASEQNDSMSAAKDQSQWESDEPPPRHMIVKIILFTWHIFLMLLKSLRFTCVFIFLMKGFSLSDFLQGFLCSSCISLDIFFFLKQHFGKYHIKNKVYTADVLKVKKKVVHECSQSVRDKKLNAPTKDVDNLDIVEHRQILSYAGWMTEIKSYDPITFHLSMTRTVYVKLDGSKLRLSSYLRRSGSSERVSKRAHWNETLQLEDNAEHDSDTEGNKKKIALTNHRYYNLLGCDIKMLPLGIARKRHFSRKYPIQLTISDKKTDKKSPGYDQMVEMNWFDFEEMKDVSATFLEKERQYEVEKGEKSFNTMSLQTSAPTQLILFARCDREKEDWYRRFYNASRGTAYASGPSLLPNLDVETDLDCSQFTDLVMVNADDVHKSMSPTITRFTDSPNRSDRLLKGSKISNSFSDSNIKEAAARNSDEDRQRIEDNYASFDETVNRIPNIGLLMTSCARRGPADYVKFMSNYQNSSQETRSESDINIGSPDIPANNNMASIIRTLLKSRKSRRSPAKIGENESNSIPVTPIKSNMPAITDADVQRETTSDIIWLNILVGRILYSCLNDTHFVDVLKNLLQKKLNAIKLPPFMENVSVTNVDLGQNVPTFDNIIPPMCDERGLWFEADISYEGLMTMTISTKLNLMRLKKVEQHKLKRNPSVVKKNTNESDDQESDENDNIDVDVDSDDDDISDRIPNATMKKLQLQAKASIYDSDAESSGASSTDSESLCQSFVDIRHTTDGSGKTPTQPSSPAVSSSGGASNGPGSSGGSKKLLRFVDRIAASNLFQSATEISYVQKAMKNMSTDIRLRFELKGIAGRIVFNIPPPPSDRVWLTFRHPPKLQMSATPGVGDHTFNWDIVTNTIESKLYEEILKILVYPNMVDVVLPVLGQSTYRENDQAVSDAI